MTDEYVTPEGFRLPKPLLMPDVRDFREVLTPERPWNFATMNHHGGYAQAETPHYINAHTGEEIPHNGMDTTRQRPVSRFCSCRNIPQRPLGAPDGSNSMMVTPTPATLELVRGHAFSFFDTVSFEAIYHVNNDRVLIVAQASGILASRWVAYVGLDTVPAIGAEVV